MVKAKYYDPNTAVYLDPNNDRRVAVITGGAGGLGWYTILHLYLHGYVVYMAARNPTKVQKAIDEIKAEAYKWSKGHAYGEIKHVQMDLMLLELVKTASQELAKAEPKIDILINNAGIMAVPYDVTKDGYEVQYQVNFVGHMLLTERLIPNLEAAPEARVVFLSSVGHNFAYTYFDPAKKVNRWPNAMWTWVRYGNAKSAEIQYVRYMAKQHPRILWLAVHPGIVGGTALYDHWTKLPVLGPIFNATVKAADAVGGVSVEEGSLSSLRAALDPLLTAAKDSGKYLTTGGPEGCVLSVASSAKNTERTVDYNYEQLKRKGFL